MPIRRQLAADRNVAKRAASPVLPASELPVVARDAEQLRADPQAAGRGGLRVHVEPDVPAFDDEVDQAAGVEKPSATRRP